MFTCSKSSTFALCSGWCTNQMQVASKCGLPAYWKMFFIFFFLSNASLLEAWKVKIHSA